jgi:hypothetical protein
MAELVWMLIGAVVGGTAVLVLATFAVEKVTKHREAEE